MVIEHIQALREEVNTNPRATIRFKRIFVSPGKSVSVKDITPVTSGSSGVSQKRLRFGAKKKQKVRPSLPQSDTRDPLTDEKLIDNVQAVATESSSASAEETLQPGDYVLIRFKGKKQDFHYVGKLAQRCTDTDTWMVHYLRNRYVVDEKSFSFGEPVNPDNYETCSDDIVKKLPEPDFVIDRLTFPAKFFTNLDARVR